MPDTAMDNSGFDLQEYLEKGVEKIVAGALKATLKDPRESAFMAGFAAACRRASKKRRRSESEGEHIPPFLIASITSSCNLHCAGCYSRCSSATVDSVPVDQLNGEEWGRIFREAEMLGISFILLAGGEPLLRRDVIGQASEVKNILFPVFTNGTYIDEGYLDTFDRHRNLVPVVSIEGGRERTDGRRGDGVYERIFAAMEKFRERGILFGVSVTVTTDNIREVTSREFTETLVSRGCRLVVYVEYVPVTEDSLAMAPGDAERDYLIKAENDLREIWPDMILLAFPGDERASGGCMAAGRGFFHINSHGGAEPCPFSPFSDVNVRELSLRDALRSKLFVSLRDGGVLDDDHIGGCVLFEKRGEVERITEGRNA